MGRYTGKMPEKKRFPANPRHHGKEMERTDFRKKRTGMSVKPVPELLQM